MRWLSYSTFIHPSSPAGPNRRLGHPQVEAVSCTMSLATYWSGGDGHGKRLINQILVADVIAKLDRLAVVKFASARPDDFADVFQ